MKFLRDLKTEITALRKSIDTFPQAERPAAPTRIRMERHTMENLAKRQAVDRMRKLGLLTPGVQPPDDGNVVRRDR